MLIPKGLAGIFTSDAELLDYAAWALRIYMGSTCLFGAQIACQQTFVAMGKAVQSLFLAVLRKIILLVPLIYIMPLFFEDKVFGVFFAEPVADFLAVCATVSLFFGTVWKMMRPGNNTD
jgi:Na+-driven multidrug efflux pump